MKPSVKVQRFGNIGKMNKLLPGLFVLLWATGYVVAKWAMPFAPPLSFLALRFGLTVLVLAVVIVWVKAPWPERSTIGHLLISGSLMHAGYLSGVWCAIKLGMPAGVSALIVNLQPVLTALWVSSALSGRTKESISKVQWLGLCLGLIGVVLVVATKLRMSGISWWTLSLSVFALLAITVGTLYQKAKAPHFDLRTGTLLQYLVSFILIIPFALWLEDEPFLWNMQLVLALAWSVLGLSIGAIFLMFWLIRRGAATQVASLFYLVPPVTALMAWFGFQESLSSAAWVGMGFTCFGVWLVQRQAASQALAPRR